MKISQVVLVCLVAGFFLVVPTFVSAQEPEDQRQTCAGCLLLPLIKVARQIGIFRNPIIPPNSVQTYRVRGIVVDNVTHAGHPRVWFGSVAEPITDQRCNVVLAGGDPNAYPGIANVRYFFADGKHTYLPDAEKLFAVPPVVVPLYTIRLKVSELPNVSELEQNLRDSSHGSLADEVAAMNQAGTIILMAQLNRSLIAAYGLGTSPTDYELVCHKPPA